MSQSVRPVDSVLHRSHGFLRSQGFNHCANASFASVLGAEINHLLPFYPLAFLQHNRQVELVALLGIHDGENLCIGSNGQWRLPYVPSRFRSYPFEMAVATNTEATRAILCFDHDSGLYREAPDSGLGEQRFFDDEGNPSQFTAELMKYMVARKQGLELTRRAAQQLCDAGLLEPMELKMNNPDSRSLMSVFKKVSQKAIRELDGAALQSLTASGAMAMAYAQVFSMSRVGILEQLYREKSREEAQQQTPPAEEFKFEESGDSFDFDF